MECSPQRKQSTCRGDRDERLQPERINRPIGSGFIPAPRDDPNPSPRVHSHSETAILAEGPIQPATNAV